MKKLKLPSKLPFFMLPIGSFFKFEQDLDSTYEKLDSKEYCEISSPERIQKFPCITIPVIILFEKPTILGQIELKKDLSPQVPFFTIPLNSKFKFDISEKIYVRCGAKTYFCKELIYKNIPIIFTMITFDIGVIHVID